MVEAALPDSQRLFIAISIPAFVKEAIERTQSECRDCLANASASWTRPENFHLTLRFLGKVKTERIPALAAAIQTASAGFSRLSLACSALGSFPSHGRPRVL